MPYSSSPEVKRAIRQSMKKIDSFSNDILLNQEYLKMVKKVLVEDFEKDEVNDKEIITKTKGLDLKKVTPSQTDLLLRKEIDYQDKYSLRESVFLKKFESIMLG